MERIGSPRSAVRLLAAGLIVCLSLGTSAASDRRLDMVAALPATSPHASLGNESKTLGRVVGTWDVEYLDYSKDGTVSHRTGEFVVGWVLDGRVVQDLWIVDPTAAGQEREVYTTLYYFEPKSKLWHAMFVDPEHASVMSFSGGSVGTDRFVLETQDTNSKTTRWSFNALRPDSFTWRDEQSSDGGHTWQLKSEYHMKRHSGSRLGSDLEAGPHGRWLSF